MNKRRPGHRSGNTGFRILQLVHYSVVTLHSIALAVHERTAVAMTSAPPAPAPASPSVKAQTPLSRVASLISNPPPDVHRHAHSPTPPSKNSIELKVARTASRGKPRNPELGEDPDTPSATSTVAPDGCTEVKDIDGDLVHIPDGGLRAWLVVAGACHILFSTFGFVVSERRDNRESWGYELSPGALAVARPPVVRQCMPEPELSGNPRWGSRLASGLCKQVLQVSNAGTHTTNVDQAQAH